MKERTRSVIIILMVGIMVGAGGLLQVDLQHARSVASSSEAAQPTQTQETPIFEPATRKTTRVTPHSWTLYGEKNVWATVGETTTTPPILIPKGNRPYNMKRVDACQVGGRFDKTPNTPEWVSVDPCTGALTLTPPASTKPTSQTIPVHFVAANGKKKLVYVCVNLCPAVSAAFPWPSGITVAPGETVRVEAKAPVPYGYSLIDYSQYPSTAVIENDGTLRVTAHENLSDGDSIRFTVLNWAKRPVEDYVVGVVEPIDVAKCVASVIGTIVPVIALVPISLGHQLKIPGLTPIVDQLHMRIIRAGEDAEHQLGLIDPHLGEMMVDINATLRHVSPHAAKGTVQLILVGAAAVGASAAVYNCIPGVESSMGLDNVELDSLSSQSSTSSQ
ncbi:Rib/alpha-like domain-containing protein [Corynebacterium cystitidis]|uniref:Rib/alpha-like domain-containing protein n=1 Tax=Corynebacterium cystitidis TaxID=35757 RepID=UPI00211EA90F|nr:Rib/alpha-like domain-containing protein [Corynebacterium cystitidis]